MKDIEASVFTFRPNECIIKFMKKGKFFKRLIICAIAAITVMSLTSCATLTSFNETFITKPEENNNTVKIGIYEPMTGSEKSEAAKEIAGIELAYTIYPTVDGKKVELIYQDNRSQLEAADAAMNELISKKPLVMLGSYGDTNSLAASAYLDKAKLPAIAITNTNPLITVATDYYFRVCIISPYQGDALAYYTYKALKEKKACVLVETGDEESATIAQRFILKMQELTGDENCIAVNTEYTPREIDYSSQLEMIRDSGVKAVLLPGSENDAANIIDQANEMNMNVTFMGIDSWNPEHIADNLAVDSTAAGTAAVAFI